MTDNDIEKKEYKGFEVICSHGHIGSANQYDTCAVCGEKVFMMTHNNNGTAEQDIHKQIDEYLQRK